MWLRTNDLYALNDAVYPASGTGFFYHDLPAGDYRLKFGSVGWDGNAATGGSQKLPIKIEPGLSTYVGVKGTGSALRGQTYTASPAERLLVVRTGQPAHPFAVTDEPSPSATIPGQ